MVHTVGIGPHLPCHRGDAVFSLFLLFFDLREREARERQNARTTKKKRLTPTVSKIEEF
jgi:hypothetical protein